jgi:hypothetical protein
MPDPLAPERAFSEETAQTFFERESFSMKFWIVSEFEDLGAGSIRRIGTSPVFSLS